MCFELECCPLYACKPAKPEVRITMDHVLHETYVKWPIQMYVNHQSQLKTAFSLT